MSKLSEKVEEDKKKSKLTLAVEKDKAFKDELCSFLYDEISNLDFKSYDYKDEKAYYLYIMTPIDEKIPVVRILYDARTTDYKVTLVDSTVFTPKNIVKLADTKKDVYEFNAICKDNDNVDIGELLFYCERHSEEIGIKKTLNEEINSGFKKENVPPKYRDRDLIKGFDDDDVAYNEALHRRLRGRF